MIQGRLLRDPEDLPEPGWLRVEAGAGETPGRIVELGAGDLPGDLAPPAAGGRDRIVCPAFTDAHVHLPQIDAVGCDGLELLDWLERVIYPAEAWWGRGGAVPSARRAIERLAAAGTAGVAAYLTSHGAGSRDAIGLLRSSGLRFLAGRVAMDRHAPEELIREDRERVRASAPTPPVLADLGAGQRHRISANPRFAVACTAELLAEIGWYVRERRPGMWVQTHLAESVAECARVAELFPAATSYAAVYDEAGLLGPRTLVALCLHLSPEEWRLLGERDAIAVHCPTANTFLEAGTFDLDAAESAGVRVALGSDVAAGPDLAMPRVARAMIEVAKLRRMTAPRGRAVRVPSPAEAWRRITSENAALLGWPDAGHLEVGASADLLVLRVPETWLDEHLAGRLLYGWDVVEIDAVVLDGRLARAPRR